MNVLRGRLATHGIAQELHDTLRRVLAASSKLTSRWTGTRHGARARSRASSDHGGARGSGTQCAAGAACRRTTRQSFSGVREEGAGEGSRFTSRGGRSPEAPTDHPTRSIASDAKRGERVRHSGAADRVTVDCARIAPALCAVDGSGRARAARGRDGLGLGIAAKRSRDRRTPRVASRPRAGRKWSSPSPERIRVVSPGVRCPTQGVARRRVRDGATRGGQGRPFQRLARGWRRCGGSDVA